MPIVEVYLLESIDIHDYTILYAAFFCTGVQSCISMLKHMQTLPLAISFIEWLRNVKETVGVKPHRKTRSYGSPSLEKPSIFDHFSSIFQQTLPRDWQNHFQSRARPHSQPLVTIKEVHRPTTNRRRLNIRYRHLSIPVRLTKRRFRQSQISDIIMISQRAVQLINSIFYTCLLSSLSQSTINHGHNSGVTSARSQSAALYSVLC